jgi:hypothetical protein
LEKFLRVRAETPLEIFLPVGRLGRWSAQSILPRRHDRHNHQRRPVSQGGNRFPLISVYAFHEVNASGVDQADIVVLSRDLNNQTPVKLRLPAAPAGKAAIYTLTGDPRSDNDSILNIPIAKLPISRVAQNIWCRSRFHPGRRRKASRS